MAKVRISFLTGIFGSAFLVLVRILLAPIASNSTVTPFVFPTTVPLPQWQPLESRPLTNPITSSPKFISGKHYRYTQNDLTLDIEMRYVVETGDVKEFLKNYSSMPPSASQLELVLLKQSGVGFYSLGADQQRAYLNSCINSRGGSTVTSAQFQRNRYTYDIRLGRLLPWLLGWGTLRDQRCLWARLSIPLKNSSQTDAYQILEKAWKSWYQWWRPRFPQP